MTSLCIDELSRRLKRRWDWPASATHVPACADAPLLLPNPSCWRFIEHASPDRPHTPTDRSGGPGDASAVCAPLPGIHGKAASSMG
jgi:hypothetical protein